MMSTQQTKSYAVFLSFNSEDREAVKTLAAYLLDNTDLRPWLDEWDLIPGEDWVDGLHRGLAESCTCAVFIGQSGEGPWQKQEVKTALLNRTKDPNFRIIPVLLPETPQDPVFPPFLPVFMWVDFRGKELDDDDALWRLECGIRGVAPGRGRPQPVEQDSNEPPEHNHVTPGLDPMPLRKAYLQWLLEQSSQLSLAGIDKKAAGKGAEDHLNLSAIYTALLTLAAEHERDQTPGFLEKSGVSLDSGDAHRRLSAVAQLNRHPRLVLLGDPDSGKSTFVNFVVLCLAGELLFPSENGQEPADGKEVCPNLKLLTAPLPDDKGNGEKERQPWEHGALLPLRVILRDFAARGLPPNGQEAKARHLWQFIVKELQANMLGDYAPYLRQHLQRAGSLILLDGLDEVPEAEQRRAQIKQVVEDFSRSFPNCRVLVTSRTYAYQKQHWRLSRFEDVTLAPFSKGQIRRFVERWYAYIGHLRGLSADNAQGRAELLKRAIVNSERLYSLAERPLLLTLMASLHAWRGGSLPEKREELYNDTVDLLLDWWESAKMATMADGSRKVEQPSLTELLNVGKDYVRAALNALAFRAHKDQQQLQGTADIAETDLVAELMDVSQNQDLRPGRLIEHLRDRAGLLVPRGIKVYTFPHRTFQEYLAACYLTDNLVDDEQYPENAAALARQAPNRWREVTLLAGAKAARGSAPSIWALAEALCYQDVSDTSDLADAWGALLAGQLLVENANLQKISPRNQAKIERLRAWLVAIVTECVPFDSVPFDSAQGTGMAAPFPAVERALAGNILAQLGDPRPGVGCRSRSLSGVEGSGVEGSGVEGSIRLPDIVWCEVPGGEFIMGSDDYSDERPPHRVTLSTSYAISRYPVTNAQYQTFVADGGYTDKWQICWSDEGWQWKEENAKTEPEKYGGEFDRPNHPVVVISWHEAAAFCQWLTRRLQEIGKLAVNQAIRLPTEAEWEKAARGEDGQTYPWGNEAITPEYANYSDTGLGVTSAVGCFPRGASPCGCEDMSGNVWEWCLDRCDFDKNYHLVTDTYTNGIIDPLCTMGSRRVGRGGAWGRLAGGCRAADRNSDAPGDRDYYLGFRLVRTPS